MFKLFLTALLPFAATAAPIFTITALGHLPVTEPGVFGLSHGLGVNNAGQVTGQSVVGSERRAFFWNGTSMQDLGTLPGDTESLGAGINNLGQVAGTSSGGFLKRAFFWDGTSMQDLSVHFDNAHSHAMAVNDSGQVAGYSTSFDSGGRSRAFFWNGTSMQDLGTLPGDVESRATGINNLGEVTGFSTSAAGVTRAFLWDGTTMHDLGVGTMGWDVNDLGQVSGFREISGYPSAAMWDGSSWIHLTPPNSPAVMANSGINNSGHIAGTAWLTSGYYWDGTAFYDLNALVPDLSGYLYFADSISDTGYITGQGIINGQPQAFLLTPVNAQVPEPSTWLLSATGLVLLALIRSRARRKRSIRTLGA